MKYKLEISVPSPGGYDSLSIMEYFGSPEERQERVQDIMSDGIVVEKEHGQVFFPAHSIRYVRYHEFTIHP